MIHFTLGDGVAYIETAFPLGTSEVFVEAVTLLGCQGNYSGDPNNPTGVHLHFSVVKDDGNGSFRNELKIQNTLDPSPYLELAVNARENAGKVPMGILVNFSTLSLASVILRV